VYGKFIVGQVTKGRWKNGFLASDGDVALAAISNLCQAVSRRQKNQNTFMS